MTYGTVNVDSVVNSDGVTSGGLYGFKNRLINGDGAIDQRNAGASFSATNGSYTVDRWNTTSYDAGATTGKFTVQQNAGSVTPPAGFKYYIGVTSSAATSVSSNGIYGVNQAIEGFNIRDLAWGTASAKSITVSFWAYSSLTGNFGGAIMNDGGNYNYPFQYTISSANTWTYCSVTIPGPTSGTWLTTTGVGLYLRFGLGGGTSWSEPAGAWTTSSAYTADSSVNVVSTSGATLYLTGVQLEKGSTATSFDYRPYGTELSLCQRYYQQFLAEPIGFAYTVYNPTANVIFKNTMRATPTLASGASFTVGSGSAGSPSIAGSGALTSIVNQNSACINNSSGNWSVGAAVVFNGGLTAEL